MVDRARPEHPSVSVIIPVGGLDPQLDAQLQALADQDVGFPFPIGASMARWASLYRDPGGTDNRYRATQDVEVSWCAQLAGYTPGFSTKAVVAYRLRDELCPLLRQSFRLGCGFVKLRGIYRPQGCPALKVDGSLRGGWHCCWVIPCGRRR